ncbi:hypothetical protein HRbin22_01007 [Candidatus Thermoflexus japonica]|uniref:PNPLA domain-containing protein n=1 Tax=Candidatus Thermoflexus japonica TaxID=2035417 RepID=A0A2H5Y5P4_9CHLR|nr:hypothetical protein HRbin22_01007 [Candidatus Thermoflexus japonica]
MRAFVLSGGGNLGAMQVGALRRLLEQGVIPDLVIGTSAGALNAAYLAAYPQDRMLSGLEQWWQDAAQAQLYPWGSPRIFWRLFRGERSLFSHSPLRRFIEARIPRGVFRFQDLAGPRLYITAAELPMGTLRLFGESPEDLILDALMSTTSIPPYHPPWTCSDGSVCIDGGVIAFLPLRVALAKGAREIYAFPILPARPISLKGDLMDLAWLAISLMLRCQVEVELRWSVEQPGVRIHWIALMPPDALPFWDFRHARALIEAGYQQAALALSQESIAGILPGGWGSDGEGRERAFPPA